MALFRNPATREDVSKCKCGNPRRQFIDSKGRKVWKWECNDCEQRRRRERYAAHEHVRLADAMRHKLYTYGVTREMFELMFSEQDGSCAICKSPFPDVVTYKNIKIDHDHQTGFVRGLLCNKCNTRLAFYEEYADICNDYIAKNRQDLGFYRKFKNKKDLD